MADLVTHREEVGVLCCYSDDPHDETIVLIMKAKPLFLFMHLLFQKVVSYPPNEPAPGGENYTPPTEL